MYRLKMMLLVFTFLILGSFNLSAQGVILYTPYTQIAVSPGESVEYSIEVINKGSSMRNVPLVVKGIPKGWTYQMKSGGWNIAQIAVLGGERKTVNLKIEIPFVVSKGMYRFEVVSPGLTVLPLALEIKQEGTSRSELSTTIPSVEGHSGSTFTFNVDLRNRSGDRQVYVLSSEAPRGWEVVFKSAGKFVSSINVESGNTEKLTVEVNPPDNIPAGKYNIPIYASTSSNTASLELSVTITGSYKIELTTPNGLLSTSVPVGGEKKIELWVKNTGSSTLSDISLEYTAPPGWEVSFDPKKITKIEAGKYSSVTAIIKADRKAIPGDYVVNIESRTQEVSSKASFRVSVKTPLLYGWIGLAVIAIGVYIIFYLFKKYGRR
ncbi:MAG: NEW3 domain-containing protein [Bacteroidales bacterium]|nr:NEW3 domain-containing protein [Bacteroidales bacterium]